MRRGGGGVCHALTVCDTFAESDEESRRCARVVSCASCWCFLTIDSLL